MMQRAADRALVRALRLGNVRSRRVAGVHLLDAPGRGALPTVVLLHGLGAGGVHYADLMRRLRPFVRRVVAPDLPGHGESDPPRPARPLEPVWAALDAVLEGPAVVFGNSLGGLAAVRLAQARPDLVAALMLVSPAGAPMSAAELPAFLRSLDFDSHAAALDFTDRVFHRRHPLRHLLALGMRERFGAEPVRRLLASATTETLLTPADLAGLTMPVSILWGGADRVFPPAHRDFFFAHLPPHAERHAPPDVGHAPFLDRPAALTAHLLSFLRRVAAPVAG